MKKRIFICCFLFLSSLCLVSCVDKDDDDDACSFLNKELGSIQIVAHSRDFNFLNNKVEYVKYSDVPSVSEEPTEIEKNFPLVQKRKNNVLRATSSIPSLKNKGSDSIGLYPYYDTKYDSAYLKDLESTCKKLSGSNTAYRARVNDKDSSMCVVDLFSCYVSTAVASPLRPDGTIEWHETTSVESNLVTYASKKTEFKVGEFITQDCKSGLSLQTNSAGSYLVFPKNLEKCTTNVVTALFDNQDINYYTDGETEENNNYALYVDKVRVNEPTLEKFLDHNISGSSAEWRYVRAIIEPDPLILILLQN